jgi:ESCRT-II complex subunit VPS36
MMALVDVYCLYNRARGTGLCFSAKYLYGIPLLHVLILFFFLIFCVELISPEDLLQACSLWEKFDVC